MGKKAEESKSFKDTAAAFGKFIYNGDDGTVLGRNGASWGRLGAFYFVYYAFLAALFAISINICLSCLPKDKPYYQTRLQTPGVTIQPKLHSKESLSTDIQYSIKDKSYEKLVSHLDDFLAPYTKEDFGPCGTAGYGYADGTPCIFVKVNKIIDWKAYGFTDLQVESDRADNRDQNSKAPALVDVLPTITSGPYDPNLIYIACYGLKEEHQDNLGKVTYYPEANPGLPLSSFPYMGPEAADPYKSPIVAVQLGEVKTGVEISVGCKAYALNILDDARTNSGFLHFKVKIDE